jgi:(p)ppGpp synthase/HD superfamily hydrolase
MNEYNTFAKALNIAGAIHRKQTRKGELDGRKVAYLIHPFKVAHTISAWTQGNYRAMAVAVLHDVLEDCRPEDKKYLEKKIRDLGDDIYESVVVLTKKKRERYDKYIQRIADSGNLTAVMVKIADIYANINDSMLFFGDLDEKIVKKGLTIHEKFSTVMVDVGDLADKAAVHYMKMGLVGLDDKLRAYNK